MWGLLKKKRSQFVAISIHTWFATSYRLAEAAQMFRPILVLVWNRLCLTGQFGITYQKNTSKIPKARPDSYGSQIFGLCCWMTHHRQRHWLRGSLCATAGSFETLVSAAHYANLGQSLCSTPHSPISMLVVEQRLGKYMPTLKFGGGVGNKKFCEQPARSRCTQAAVRVWVFSKSVNLKLTSQELSTTQHSIQDFFIPRRKRVNLGWGTFTASPSVCFHWIVPPSKKNNYHCGLHCVMPISLHLPETQIVLQLIKNKMKFQQFFNERRDWLDLRGRHKKIGIQYNGGLLSGNLFCIHFLALVLGTHFAPFNSACMEAMFKPHWKRNLYWNRSEMEADGGRTEQVASLSLQLDGGQWRSMKAPLKMQFAM